MDEIVKKVEDPEYISIDPITIANAIRIYQHWKQLDGEVRAISTRGINFPCELSEIFGCYALDYLWKKKGGGDALDPEDNLVIEMKGSGSERDDLSSFSPSEHFDRLVFLKVNKDEDAIYIWCTDVDSTELSKIKVNANETVGDQQKAGRRPRFSVQKKIIEARNLKPDFKFDILSKEIFKIN